MRARNVFSGLAVAAALAAVNPPVQAQNRESGATVEEQFTLPVPAVEPLPRDFKTVDITP